MTENQIRPELTDPFGPLDDEYAGVSYDEPQCDNCDLDDLEDVELRLTPCGLTLCSDCAFEHHGCLECSQAEHNDYLDRKYHQLKDEGLL